MRLREGSFLLPKWPAPLGMRGRTAMCASRRDRRLVNAGGGKAPAANSAYVITIMRGNFRNEKGELERFLLADGIGVGYGARPIADGIDAVYFVAQESYPVEFLENGYPVRLLRYGVVPDSGGAGISRRLRHRARIRDPGRGRVTRGVHRQLKNPPMGIEAAWAAARGGRS